MYFTFRSHPTKIMGVSGPFLTGAIVSGMTSFFSGRRFVLGNSFCVRLPIGNLFRRLRAFKASTRTMFLPYVCTLHDKGSIISMEGDVFSRPFCTRRIYHTSRIHRRQHLQFGMSLLKQSYLVSSTTFGSSGRIQRKGDFQLIVNSVGHKGSRLLLGVARFRTSTFTRLHVRVKRQFVGGGGFEVRSGNANRDGALLLSTKRLIQRAILRTFRLRRIGHFFSASFCFLFQAILRAGSVKGVVGGIRVQGRNVFLGCRNHVSTMEEGPFSSFTIGGCFPIVQLVRAYRRTRGHNLATT